MQEGEDEEGRDEKHHKEGEIQTLQETTPSEVLEGR